jgi:ABC-type uncharacterized transport system permease subunit
VVTTIMLERIAVSLVAWAINFLKFTEAPEGQNVDLRTDQFRTGTVGDRAVLRVTPAPTCRGCSSAIAAAISCGS